ncbi:MAG: hypothetical protein M3Y49_14170, partial [Actinomycetota bacterium]|nr:hypothetical protein [Actinomycetota bacterium]
MNTALTRFSLRFSPGARNRQICHSHTGLAMMMPSHMAIFNLMLKESLTPFAKFVETDPAGKWFR